MIKILNWISNHLLQLAIGISIFSLIFPQIGSALNWLVTPILAIMVFNVSMTIKAEDLRQIKNNPLIIIWSVFLQFVPMVLFSFLLSKSFFHTEDLKIGQLLLGSLPADISAPLMVYLIGGSTALATSMLVLSMLFTPFLLPNIIKLLGGISLKVPTSYLVIELILIILLPVILGIILNKISKYVRKNEDIWSGNASLCYVILLFIVVSTNATSIISLGTFAILILFVELLLNLFGYLLAFVTKLIFKKEKYFLPILFLTSSKEFGIASASIDTMKLNSSIVIPSTFYAVVQMISMPTMVKIINSIKNKKQT